MMPPPLPPEVFDALPPAVQYYIRCLEALAGQVAGLSARVAELEARLKQDSSNSHQPPSSDGPHVKPAPPRKPSGKRRGGQSGHPKHDRVLLPPDEVHDRKPGRCRRCCTKLAGDDPDPVIDQVLELPEKLRHVIHYRRHRLCCPRCRAVTTADPVRGTGCGCAKTEAVCRDILAAEASLWTFVKSGGVEPTNNAAERAVRHTVCWRKTSYGTDGETGSRFVERVLTVVASCRSQGRSVLEFLTLAVDPHRDGTQKLTILPATA